MPELKVLEKIRRVLLDDATVKGYVADRVFAAHISTITDPKYPAISLLLMPGSARVNVPVMADVMVQIDLWFNSDQYTADDLIACMKRVRALLHRQSLTDTAIGVTVGVCNELTVGPIMYDEESACHHLPCRYGLVAL